MLPKARVGNNRIAPPFAGKPRFNRGPKEEVSQEILRPGGCMAALSLSERHEHNTVEFGLQEKLYCSEGLNRALDGERRR